VGLVIFVLLFWVMDSISQTIEEVEELRIESVVAAEAREENRLQVVSADLDLPAKNILFVGYKEFDDVQVAEYRTDQGSYLGDVEGEGIKSILKYE